MYVHKVILLKADWLHQKLIDNRFLTDNKSQKKFNLVIRRVLLLEYTKFKIRKKI